MHLGVYLGVSSNSPLGIHKLFTTGKSHAPAHIFGRIQVWIIVPSPLPFAYLSSGLQQLEYF